MLTRIVIVLAMTVAVAPSLFAGVPVLMDPVSFSAEAAESQNTMRLHQKAPRTAKRAKSLEDPKYAEAKAEEALTEQLSRAIEAENTEKMKALLSAGAGLHRYDREGKLPLETAARKGSMQLIRPLLDRRADVNAKRPDGTTALMWAMALDRAEMVKLLLERGADAAAVLTDGPTVKQWDTFHVRDDMLKLFAERGIKLTLAGVAMSGLRNEARRLLDQGADANAKGARGTTALMECAREGDLETARRLLDTRAGTSTPGMRGAGQRCMRLSGRGIWM